MNLQDATITIPPDTEWDAEAQEGLVYPDDGGVAVSLADGTECIVFSPKEARLLIKALKRTLKVAV